MGNFKTSKFCFVKNIIVSIILFTKDAACIKDDVKVDTQFSCFGDTHSD